MLGNVGTLTFTGRGTKRIFAMAGLNSTKTSSAADGIIDNIEEEEEMGYQQTLMCGRYSKVRVEQCPDITK